VVSIGFTGAQPGADYGRAGSCLNVSRLALAWRGVEVWLASEDRLDVHIVRGSDARAASLSGTSKRLRGGAGTACERITATHILRYIAEKHLPAARATENNTPNAAAMRSPSATGWVTMLYRPGRQTRLFIRAM
jgi:hypothetical protein